MSDDGIPKCGVGQPCNHGNLDRKHDLSSVDSKAIERRRSVEMEEQKLVCGLITLDAIRHNVEVSGKAIRLTSAEFKLLTLLMRKPGRVHSREMLLSGAWGYEAFINTRTVDTHIRRLRDKLGKAANAIETVRGFGYRLLADS